MRSVIGFTPVVLTLLFPESVEARAMGYEMRLVHEPIERTVTVLLDPASRDVDGHVEASIIYPATADAWPAVHEAAVKALERVK